MEMLRRLNLLANNRGYSSGRELLAALVAVDSEREGLYNAIRLGIRKTYRLKEACKVLEVPADFWLEDDALAVRQMAVDYAGDGAICAHCDGSGAVSTCGGAIHPCSVCRP